MAQVVGLEDIPAEKIIHNKEGGPDRPAAKVYPYLWPSARKDRDPTNAFLVRYELGTQSSAHYHAADQFQIIVEGKGLFGRHELAPYHVHFARAYTPYGPLIPDKKEGWGFITLRSRPDPEGAQRLSVAREKLERIPNRKPWQVTRKVDFPPAGAGVSVKEIPDVKDDQGLFALAVSLSPGARTAAPDPSSGDGQYVLVVRGSLHYNQRHYAPLSVVFIKPDEPPFEMVAGPSGLEAIVLNFPRVASPSPRSELKPGSDGGFKTWQCKLCAFVYDEEQGLPEEGIAPGTRWKDVPEDWSCPDCGVQKADFEMVEI